MREAGLFPSNHPFTHPGGCGRSAGCWGPEAVTLAARRPAAAPLAAAWPAAVPPMTAENCPSVAQACSHGPKYKENQWVLIIFQWTQQPW